MAQIEQFNHLSMFIITVIRYLKPYGRVQIICIREDYMTNRITNVVS